MNKNFNKSKPKDTIRGLNPSPKGRDIVFQIANALNMTIHEDENGISAYGGNCIRLANHCTYLETWVDNGTCNAPYRYDIVIEDAPTQAVTDVKLGFDFIVTEFVHSANNVTPQIARTIAYDIRNTIVNNNTYANNAGGEKRELRSTHKIIKDKQTRDMKESKQIVKLNESQLRQIIRENLDEFIGGMRPSVRVGDKKFNMEDMAYEIRNTLRDLQQKGKLLNDLIAQSLPWMEFGNMGEQIQLLGAEVRDRASQLLTSYDPDDYAEKCDSNPDESNNVCESKSIINMKQTIKLNESKLRQIIKESIKKVLNETYNPFDDYDFEEWEKENVEPVTDEEYNRIRKMDFIYHANEVYRKIGDKKWNGFIRRLEHENPEEYEVYDRENAAFPTFDPEKDLTPEEFARYKQIKGIVNEGIGDEQVTTHDNMWRALTDAYNYSLDIREGAELYKDAFEEQIFPLIRKIDKTLGW